ncbi:MAG: hypothetical protein AB1716_04330 [Planctomycetota bacterium]
MHVRMTSGLTRNWPSGLRCAAKVGLAALGCALLAGGCTIDLGLRDDPPPVNPAPLITVQVINQTSKPLDPQVYIGRVAYGRDLLFDPVNKRTDFGFATIGLVAAGEQAEFTVECGVPVYIATAGGIYGDNLAVPLGAGQPKILEEGASVTCGDVITFTYTASGAALQTSYSVQSEL